MKIFSSQPKGVADPLFDQPLFIERLRRLREERGMTQSDLADALGVTRGAIGHWEAGKREPSLDVISTIAGHFGVSVDYLLGETDLKNEYEVARYLIDQLELNGFVKDGRIDVQTIDKFMSYIAVIRQIKES